MITRVYHHSLTWFARGSSWRAAGSWGRRPRSGRRRSKHQAQPPQKRTIYKKIVYTILLKNYKKSGIKQGLRQLKKGTDSKVTERGSYNCFGTASF